jgi:Domain of unknown function (DUF1772)
MTDWMRILRPLTLVFTAIFFGIAAYIGFVEQTARLALDVAPMLQAWQVSFGYGMVLQGALAVLTGGMGLLTFWRLRDWRWLVGALLMLANWPWTLLLMAPLNGSLLAANAQTASPETVSLIQQWGSYHMGRVALSALATLAFIWATARTDLPQP